MKKVSLTNVVKFAGAYVACAIGSGFATGQEIMQFFTAQGIASILGCLVTMGVFGWVGGTIMKHARALELKDPGAIVRYYFGNTMGRAFEIIFQVFLFGIFVIMIAGAGATLAEYYGINPYVGRVIMTVIAFLSVILSLRKLTDILGSMGVVIIVFSVAIGLISFFRNPGALMAANEMAATMDLTKTAGGWFFSSILYPAFNAICVLIFAAGIGAGANNEKEALYGGLLGGLLFGLAVLCMNLGLMANFSAVVGREVPTLVLANQLGGVVGVIFSVIIICGVYTTAVPMLWSTASCFGPEGTKRFKVAALVLAVLAFLLGMTDFSVLVNTIYPASGYMGIILMLTMLGRCLFDKRNKLTVGHSLNQRPAKKGHKSMGAISQA